MQRGRLITRWVLTLAIIAACSTCLIMRMPSRGGDPLPKTPPAESRRVRHPQGFSIVAPEGWLQSVDAESIVLSAGPSRYSDYINVIVIDPNVYTQQYNFDGEFLGKPAARATKRTVDRSGHASLFSVIVFKSSDRLFEIVYERWANPPPDRIPEPVWPYLESFRDEGQQGEQKQGRS